MKSEILKKYIEDGEGTFEVVSGKPPRRYSVSLDRLYFPVESFSTYPPYSPTILFIGPDLAYWEITYEKDKCVNGHGRFTGKRCLNNSWDGQAIFLVPDYVGYDYITYTIPKDHSQEEIDIAMKKTSEMLKKERRTDICYGAILKFSRPCHELWVSYPIYPITQCCEFVSRHYFGTWYNGTFIVGSPRWRQIVAVYRDGIWLTKLEAGEFTLASDKSFPIYSDINPRQWSELLALIISDDKVNLESYVAALDMMLT